ncbi:MAG: hypothetical protein U0103_16465 [Candidatus Obscuribacterales bacterium]
MKHAYSLTNIAVQNLLLLLCVFAGSPAQALDQQVIEFVVRPVRGILSHCGGYTFTSDIQPWLAKCERQIRRAGFVEKEFAGKMIKIQISFSEIKSSSALGVLTIVHSSDSKVTDDAALRLIKTASPFDFPGRLPENRPITVEMEYPRLELKFAPLKKDRDYRPWQIDPYVPDTRPRLLTKRAGWTITKD